MYGPSPWLLHDDCDAFLSNIPPGETGETDIPPGADTFHTAPERPPSRAAEGRFIGAQRRPLTA